MRGPQSWPPSTSRACVTPRGLSWVGAPARDCPAPQRAAVSVRPARAGANAASTLVSAMGSLSGALSCPTAASLDTLRPYARCGWVRGCWDRPRERAARVWDLPAAPRPQTWCCWVPGSRRPVRRDEPDLGAWDSCGSSGSCLVRPWMSLAEREPCAGEKMGGSRGLRQLLRRSAAGASGERWLSCVGPRRERKTRPLPPDSSPRTSAGASSPRPQPPGCQGGEWGDSAGPRHRLLHPVPRAGSWRAVSLALPEPRPPRSRRALQSVSQDR